MTRMNRADYAAIAQWVPQDARVLDLGCGDGELLNFLRNERGATGYGVEIAADNILACVKNGVNVIQMDLESGLSGFQANSFDCVILSQTLQAVRKTELMVREMLRVGREAIVTFPNFGYWRHRMHVLRGHMPVSRDLPYQWFDTPNVHLCTLADFEAFCGQLGVRILERMVLDDGQTINVLPNLRGSLAIYRVKAGK
ncbi:MAG TPA: methionine biosynthesis protein MetW [Burkholderiales bacterium]|nr:methionine biosynthesis protein MetW [Burkholderiales bacterium]